MPENGHLGVIDQPLGHNLGRPQFPTSNEHINMARIFGQIRRLLGGTIPTTDHRQRLVPENRNGTITDRTGRDPTLPIRPLSRQVHPLGTGTGRHDDRISRLERLGIVLLALTPVPERTRREVKLGYGLGDDRRAESFGLGAELVHHFRAADAVGETGEVFHLGEGGCQCGD